MRTPDGRLLRTFNAGEARLNAYLEDHAFVLEALLTLYEATFEERWFTAAREIADTIVDRFADPANGGFFSTSDDHEELVARRKDLEDAPIPSGGSAAAFGLLRLAALTGEARYEDHAVSHLRLLHEIAPRHPTAFGHLLQAIDFHLAPVREVALAGEPAGIAALAEVARSAFRPHVVLAGRRGRRRVGGAADAGPHAGRRARGGLRVRALRLPAAGDVGRGVARAAGRLNSRRSGAGRSDRSTSHLPRVTSGA